MGAAVLTGRVSFLLLIVPTLAFASLPSLELDPSEELDPPQITVVSSGPGGIEMEFQLPALSVKDVTVGGQDFQEVIIPRGGHTGEVGNPQIPTFARFISIPDRAGVEVVVTIEEEEEIGQVRLVPVQPDEGGPFIMNEAAYQRDDFGTAPGARVGSPAILRDLRIVPLTLLPVRYNPDLGLLKVARRIRVEVSFSGENLENTRDRSPRPIAPSFDDLYRHLVVNYEGPPIGQSIKPGGLVIICPNIPDVISRLQPLVEWKERKGWSVTLATTAETGTSKESIKAWLQFAYDHDPIPPEYICLVGDGSGSYAIDYYTNSGGGGDHQYTMLDGADYLPDAHIGRLSINTLTELEAIVNKIIGYESTPYLQDDPGWYTRACLVGDPSPSGYSTIYVQQCVKDRLRDIGYTEIDTIYSGDFGDQMRTSLNQGDTIFGYRGYIGMSGWTNSHTYALLNGWKMPFVVTITCATGSWSSGTSISEGFLRANSTPDYPKGGIGCIGTATAGTHTRYNNCMYSGIFWGLLFEDQTTMGAALSRGKVEMYLNYIDNEAGTVLTWCVWNNLMGDPSCDVWTGYPEEISVDHPATIPFGSNSLIVTVDSFGSPVAEAQVCALKGTESVAVGFTDATGRIELPLTMATGGELQLTVTKHNHRPYLAAIPVVTGERFIGIQAFTVDDDVSGESNGNGDFKVNPGETIELPVQLRNFDIGAIPGVTAALVCDDPYVTLTDDFESYGDIPGGGSLWCPDDFGFTVDPACPHDRMLRFGLEVESGTDTWHSLIDIPVISADLVAVGTTLYNDGGNGLLDPGETVEMSVVLQNEGGLPASSVTGTLSCENSFITILDDFGSFGTINPDQDGENVSDRFSISAAGNTYPGLLAVFSLVTTFSDGVTDTTTVPLTIGERATEDPIGPDQYGYLAFDNTDTGYAEAPTYDWIEIDPDYGGSGVEVPLSDHGTYQDDTRSVDLPFAFGYYGETFDKVSICSNGWVALGWSWLVNYRNWTIPGAGGPNGMLCGFWDDLRIGSGAGVFTYYDTANHRFIIEYSHVQNETGGQQTFEIILYDPNHYSTPSGDGYVVYQYQAVNNNDYGDNYATVGIESPDGFDGLLYSYSNNYPAGAATLVSGRAIRFVPVSAVPTGAVTGQVTNASAGDIPLPGAQVAFSPNGGTFITGGDGRYVGTVPVGLYMVVASAEGFEPDTIRGVGVTLQGLTETDFSLTDIAGPTITVTTHPSTSDTEGPYPIPVTLHDASGIDERIFHYRPYGYEFTELPLEHLIGDDYMAEIPGQPYITQIEYYVYARDAGGRETVDPPGAPAVLHSFFVAPTIGVWADDLESEQGWTIGASGDDATTGIWERVDPTGTYNGEIMVQPEDDHTLDPGHLCFITGGQDGGNQGSDYDVDGGKTTLLTPVFDLSIYPTVTVRYYRWYTNDTGNSPGEDVWLVEVTNDGVAWHALESTSVSERSWLLREFDLGETIELTDQVQIRFVASDEGGGSLVEAAVDDFEILFTGVVDAPPGDAVAPQFTLLPSRPNPMKEATKIVFKLDQPAAANLALYDVQGRLVRMLVKEQRPAGLHTILWDGRDERGARMPAGIYFYRLDIPGRSEVRKLVRLE